MNKKAFYKISYGLYIVSTKVGEKLNGFISNSVFQITSEPPQFAVACHKDNFTASLLEQSKTFSVSVLHKDVAPELIRGFGFKSGIDNNKFENVNYKFGSTGVPIVLDGTLAFLECEIGNIYEYGTHTLFIGKVVNSDVIYDEKEPLTYAYYRDVIKGTAPKNAPTFQTIEDVAKDNSIGESKKYRCNICGYVYNPSEGDANGEIPPGTEFEDLPDDWTCPVCGAEKSEFSEV